MTVWVEKYRPKTFEEVVGLDPRIVELVKDPQSMPHFLFIGHVGTGKTTVARLIIKYLQAEHIELNASDERGIDTIRQKVKTFARTKRRTVVPRIIFLDEADALTPDAQTALRNTMEKYSKNAKFILTANYEHRIIDAIKSRCEVVRFGEPPKEDILDRLTYICQQEGVRYDPVGLAKLIDAYYPDIRTMINVLQLLAKDGMGITVDVVLTYTQIYDEIYEMVKQGNVEEVRRFWIERGLDPRVVLKEIFNRMLADKGIQRYVKDNLLWLFAEVDYRMSVGADPEIQLAYFVNAFAKTFGGG